MHDWKQRLPALNELLDGADHVDVKVQRAPGTLREFVAGMMAYEPWWVRFLFALRKRAVRLIGLKQPDLPRAPRWTAALVPMTAGQRASFFTVRLAREEVVWAVDVEERHLRAVLAVVHAGCEFLVVTIVHYKHWTGPLYFNVIRPFHHVVVRGMADAGARGPA